MRYLLLGLFAFFGLLFVWSPAPAAEVVSASFYTHPQTGERVLLRYTVAGEPGVVGQTEREVVRPFTVNGSPGTAAQIEAAFASNTPVYTEGAFGVYDFTFQSKPIGRPVAPPPVYYLPNCPNGRCPLK